jgi:acetylglutamate kinase
MEDLIKRSEVLIESLPYLRSFYQKTFVIKYGGHAMIDKDLKCKFALDVVLLKYVGLNPIIVHGGGPQIGEILKKMDIPSRFIEGFRVTDDATMDVVQMVLVGKINKEIVDLINQAGGKAVGLSGKDGCLIEAKKIFFREEELIDKPPEIIDLGHVGEVIKVNKEILELLGKQQFIPIVAPVGVGQGGETFNINADLVAGEIAASLKAKKLILLTDVAGVLDKHKNLISSMMIEDGENLIKNKTITGGMIPKVKAAIKALKAGVDKAHIVDGRIPHVLLLELFTSRGVGTEIVRMG